MLGFGKPHRFVSSVCLAASALRFGNAFVGDGQACLVGGTVFIKKALDELS